MYVLGDFQNLKPELIGAIMNMFDRISSTEKCNKEALFYKASYLYRFNKIISSPMTRGPNFDRLSSFISLIGKNLSIKLKENPSLVVEVNLTNVVVLLQTQE
jgi:hypothetical protein